MSSCRPVYIPKRRKLAAHNNEGKHANATERNKIPFQKRHTKNQHSRFHGAFTGGFSAGHFNTVGTKEGWAPSQVKKRDQKLEDFMDEEDHSEWGGPTRLREEFGSKAGAPAAAEFGQSRIAGMNAPGEADLTNLGTSMGSKYQMPLLLPLKSILEVSHETIGPRLLRRLGWREGRSAIIPENETTIVNSEGKEDKDNENENDLEKASLSKRRLRKLQLQSSRIVKLPSPKLDQCGLGFEPYKDAPEFERYREQRRKRAQDRASYNRNAKDRNVYRLSDIAADPFGGGDSALSYERNTRKASGSSDYLGFETTEDFVGRRSAAGFALRDDEDDAYDDEGFRKGLLKKGGLLEAGDEYNTEAYEHEYSSDDECDVGSSLPKIQGPFSVKMGNAHSPSNGKSRNPVDAGNVFAAWAGTNPSTEGKLATPPPSSNHKGAITRARVTSDKRAPITGFVVGGSMDTSKKRYPGPDILRNYTVQKHVFGEHENPLFLEAISNAVKLEQKDERTARIEQQETQHQTPQGITEPSNRPLTENFSSLADAMRNRFTSGESSFIDKGDSSHEKQKAFPGGLHMPSPVQHNNDAPEGTDPSNHGNHNQKIAIQRTVQSFFPNPLVCKRFRVPIPSKARKNNACYAIDSSKTKESLYFEKEILQKAIQQTRIQPGNTVPGTHGNRSANTSESRTSQSSQKEGQGTRSEIERPSIEKLKSVFEASSDESSLSEDGNEGSDTEEREPHADPTIKATTRDPSRSIEAKLPLREGGKDSPNDTIETNAESIRAIVEYQFSSPLRGEEDVSIPSGSNSDGYGDDGSSMGRKRKKEKRPRNHDRRRKRHKRKRSRSTDRDRDSRYYSDNTEEEDGRARDRRRRKDKKRKKERSSSSKYR